MALMLCDGTEGNFLKKENELLIVNGFAGLPFSEEQLSNKDRIPRGKDKETVGECREEVQEFGGFGNPRSRNYLRKTLRKKRARKNEKRLYQKYLP